MEQKWWNINSGTIMVEVSWWNSDAGTVIVEQSWLNGDSHDGTLVVSVVVEQ